MSTATTTVSTFARTSTDTSHGAWEEHGALTYRAGITTYGFNACADVAMLTDGTLHTWTFGPGPTESDEWPATALLMGVHS